MNDQDWRDDAAAALESQVIKFGDALYALDVVEAILEHDHDHAALVDIRACTGRLRERAAGKAGMARQLRANPAPPVLPMTMTTRHIRPAPEIEEAT